MRAQATREETTREETTQAKATREDATREEVAQLQEEVTQSLATGTRDIQKHRNGWRGTNGWGDRAMSMPAV
jgi:hypothetical protein